MSEGGRETDEKFLSRWSRLKRTPSDAEAAPPPPAVQESKPAVANAPPVDLPPVESLTKDSDYSVFFQPKVDEGLRRAALKKLFTDPHFNVMDGLDTYIEDYSITEPISAEALAGMRSAQKIFQWARGESDEEAAKKEEASRLAVEEQGALVVQTEPETLPAASTTETQAKVTALTEDSNPTTPSFQRRPESST